MILTVLRSRLRARVRTGWLEAFTRFVHGPHGTRAEVDPAVTVLVEQTAAQTLRHHLTVDGEGSPVQFLDAHEL